MLSVHSPYDRRVLAEISLHTAADVEAGLATAAALHARRQTLPKFERIAILEQTAVLLRARQEEFAQRIAREGGKPLTDARIESARAADGLVASARVLAAEQGREVPLDLTAATAGRTAHTLHEPIGPVVAVSAFNHPLNLIVHQVAPAVAAGCPVLVKPAGTTPLSCIALVELLQEAGLPPDWVRVLVVDNDLAGKLVADARVAFFSFIGSARVGWALRRRLADGARCALEHGGCAPVLIEPDADLDAAVPALVKGGYYHAGQVCVSVQRIFVHRSRHDELVAKLTAAVTRLQVGDPEKATTEVGPLIQPREVDRVGEWVEEARAGGAFVACGGEAVSNTLYQPTVVVEPPRESRLATAEVFGPVTTVVAYDDAREAVARANALPWSFQAAVFTRDLQRAHTLATALDASAVMINDHTAFRADWMPFAGRRTSGLGVGGIPHTFHDLRPEKLIVVRHAPDQSAC